MRRPLAGYFRRWRGRARSILRRGCLSWPGLTPPMVMMGTGMRRRRRGGPRSIRGPFRSIQRSERPRRGIATVPAGTDAAVPAFSGEVKLEFCRRIGKSWKGLADLFDIHPHERQRFSLKDEPHDLWEWLEMRLRLRGTRVGRQSRGSQTRNRPSSEPIATGPLPRGAATAWHHPLWPPIRQVVLTTRSQSTIARCGQVPAERHDCRFPLVKWHRRRNGADKTTTMRAIFGLTSLDAGSVRWNDAPVTQAERRRRARAQPGPARPRRTAGRSRSGGRRRDQQGARQPGPGGPVRGAARARQPGGQRAGTQDGHGGRTGHGVRGAATTAVRGVPGGTGN
jgi:hypothetical protein